MSFVLKNVIRKISSEILQEYCNNNNIAISFKTNESIKKKTNQFINIFEQSNRETQTKIESDFQEINELKSAKGITALIEEAQRKRLAPEELEIKLGTAVYAQ